MAAGPALTPNSASTSLEVSPFLDPGWETSAGSIAILQLSRDNLVPIYLQEPAGKHDGYAEGHVVNTRYGSFPHSTMLGVPWGSQIRASQVDTGSRGRKRKRPAAEDVGREETEDTESTPGPAEGKTDDIKEAIVASSGFIHVLPPTAETWTMSLPHRTQVVYTPDYSYILHRIRARPGTRLIEAGAGSGSFTHASVRAVYNGYPAGDEAKGKVFSFEFHDERYRKMKEELSDHKLEGVVHLTHRNVYKDGFGVEGQHVEADAVFLDLPAPWEALPHLTRRQPLSGETNGSGSTAAWKPVLNPKKSVHICTFSPCIEQVTRTVSAMRKLGWVDIEMVELAHKKLYTVRERTGLYFMGDRGVNNSAKDVEEAVVRLVEIEARSREHNAKSKGTKGEEADMDVDEDIDGAAANGLRASSKPELITEPEWVNGQLVARGEPEVKTHTSYLVFAVLPREWGEEDEAAALARWPVGNEKKVIGKLDKATRKREKRELLQEMADKKAQKKQKKKELATRGEGKADEAAQG